MALSIILRRSASRVISGGNRFYGNLVLPCASVSSFRQFCSSPLINSQDGQSLVNDAKRPTLDNSLVNDLLSQLQSLRRDIELLRKPNNESLPTESLGGGVGTESVLESFDCNSTVKGNANDEGDDSESDDDDSSTDESDDDDSDSKSDYSSDESDDDSSDANESDSNDESGNDIKEKSSTETHNSKDDESPPESDDKASESEDKLLPENKNKDNEELLKVIQSEILSAKKFMQLSAPDAVIPVDFPFKINGDYYRSFIWWSRKYKGEHVVISNPRLHSDTMNYQQKKDSSFGMDLTVVVISNSIKVEYKCTARKDGISIFTVRNHPAYKNYHVDGVSMSEFNENLKEEFRKYLEARGITMSTTNFIYGYMLDRANKERLSLLENIQKQLV